MPAQMNHQSSESLLSYTLPATSSVQTLPTLTSATASYSEAIGLPYQSPPHPGHVGQAESSPISPPPVNELSPSNHSSGMSNTNVTPTQRISRAKKGKRVHACQHEGCEKIFTRAEHLRRHALNHSTSTPYKCDLCEKTFVRHDLLSRHVDRHNVQARKAYHTLALAQRHRQFSSHFGISGIPLPPPNSYPSGGPIFRESHNQHYAHAHPPNPPRLITGNTTQLPHFVTGRHPHASSSATDMSSQGIHEQMIGYSPSYHNTTPMSLSGNSPHEYHSANTTPSPSVHVHRQRLPFQIQPSEQTRPPDFSAASAPLPEIPSRRYSSADEQSSSMYPQNPMSAWENFPWPNRQISQPSRKTYGYCGEAGVGDR